MSPSQLPPISVLTLVRGRRRQLRNVMLGLAQSSVPPAEFIIAAMDSLTLAELPAVPFPVQIVQVPTTPQQQLPLARARNSAARTATYEELVFLDVDCIPAPELLGDLVRLTRQTQGAAMGTVRYLSREASVDTVSDVETLQRASVPHPNRPQLAVGAAQVAPAYHLFWTLCVAMSRTTFEQVGGFDEAYTGYGAEDTDFAFRLRAANVPFHLSGARCFHQYHDVYRPPLNHLADIVHNCRVFYAKWSSWPMEGWLTKFAGLGLIEWTPGSDATRLLRLPTEAEVFGALQRNGQGF